MEVKRSRSTIDPHCPYGRPTTILHRNNFTSGRYKSSTALALPLFFSLHFRSSVVSAPLNLFPAFNTAGRSSNPSPRATQHPDTALRTVTSCPYCSSANGSDPRSTATYYPTLPRIPSPCQSSAIPCYRYEQRRQCRPIHNVSQSLP
jgi:hypothetical protein